MPDLTVICAGLTRLQGIFVSELSRAKLPLTSGVLADRLWRDDVDGGPMHTGATICSLAKRTNDRIASFGLRIEALKGPGGGYRLLRGGEGSA